MGYASLLKDVKTVQQDLKDNTPYREDDRWAIDGLAGADQGYSAGISLARYEESFKEFLEEKNGEATTFAKLLESRKHHGLPTNVLDLFGGAYFLNDLQFVDNIIGVRRMNVDQNLSSYYKNHPDPQYLEILNSLRTSPKRKVLEGDLYRSKTWRVNLAAECQKRGISSFDLIVCRPYGPFRGDSMSGADGPSPEKSMHLAYLRFYLILLDRTYRLCSSQDGFLFTQVPSIPFSEEIFKTFSLRMNQHPGLESELALDGVQNRSFVLKIVKKRNAPESLLTVLDPQSEGFS